MVQQDSSSSEEKQAKLSKLLTTKVAALEKNNMQLQHWVFDWAPSFFLPLLSSILLKYWYVANSLKLPPSAEYIAQWLIPTMIGTLPTTSLSEYAEDILSEIIYNINDNNDDEEEEQKEKEKEKNVL